MSEELKLSASNLGFDPSWVTDILQKYGAEILALAVEAVRSGFSVNFVVDVLKVFGPTLLQFLISLANKKKFAATGEVIAGDVVTGTGVDINVVEILIEKYMPQIIETYLPILMQKYGDQISQFLVQLVVNALKPQPTK